MNTTKPLTKTDSLIAALLFLTALAARWPFIMNGETLLHSDEAIVGIMAQDIAAGIKFPVYFYGQSYMGALEAYVMAFLNLFIDDQIITLRLAPALFLALLTSLQYLLLKVWFNREAGLWGAAVTIFLPPALMQWSLAPRGAYIEIMVWGTLLWLIYWLWFKSQGSRAGYWGYLTMGALIGSGFWLNQTILLFLLPVIAHKLFQNIDQFTELPPLKGLLKRAKQILPFESLLLPAFLLIFYLILTAIWSVHIGETGVQHRVFFNLFSSGLFKTAIVIILLITAFFLILKYFKTAADFLKRTPEIKFLIAGLILGHLPALIAVISGTNPIDPRQTIPMGARALWEFQDTLTYLKEGLPILFSASPEKYLKLVQMGHHKAASIHSDILLSNCNWIIISGSLALIMLLIQKTGKELSQILAFRPVNISPATFILISSLFYLIIYTASGFSFDFTSIRYLVPLTAFIPGLLSAGIFISDKRINRNLGRFTLAVLITCWGAGQLNLLHRLGEVHPYHKLTEELRLHNTSTIYAETTDCHLITYLSKQKTTCIEWGSWWPRLDNAKSVKAGERVFFLMQVEDYNWEKDWHDAEFPGKAPVETSRELYPYFKKLREAGKLSPVSITKLAKDTFELWKVEITDDNQKLLKVS